MKKILYSIKNYSVNFIKYLYNEFNRTNNPFYKLWILVVAFIALAFILQVILPIFLVTIFMILTNPIFIIGIILWYYLFFYNKNKKR